MTKLSYWITDLSYSNFFPFSSPISEIYNSIGDLSYSIRELSNENAYGVLRSSLIQLKICLIQLGSSPIQLRAL